MMHDFPYLDYNNHDVTRLAVDKLLTPYEGVCLYMS